MSGWFNDTQNRLMMGAECRKISDIWLIYQRIFVSFENIFVSEVFADFFISFLQKLFMRIVLEKRFGDAHTSKWSQRIYIYIYIHKYIYIYIYIYIYVYIYIDTYILFNQQCIFSTQPHGWLNFSCLIELQMLLRCCLIIHINIKLRHFLWLYILLLGILGLFIIYVVSMWSISRFYLHFHYN